MFQYRKLLTAIRALLSTCYIEKYKSVVIYNSICGMCGNFTFGIAIVVLKLDELVSLPRYPGTISLTVTIKLNVCFNYIIYKTFCGSIYTLM